MRVAGEERWAAIEDAGRLRDALGTPLPVGVPEAFLEPVRDPLGDLVARYRPHPRAVPAADVAARFGLGTRRRRAGAGPARRHRPGGRPASSGPAVPGAEWCDAEVLRTLRRRSLAALRKEVEPVPVEALAPFLPAWQQVGSRLRGAAGVLRVVEQLQGARCRRPRSSRWCCRPGCRTTPPRMLDELTAAGEVLWAGTGRCPGPTAGCRCTSPTPRT